MHDVRLPDLLYDEIIDAFAELADKGNLLPYLDIPSSTGPIACSNARAAMSPKRPPDRALPQAPRAHPRAWPSAPPSSPASPARPDHQTCSTSSKKSSSTLSGASSIPKSPAPSLPLGRRPRACCPRSSSSSATTRSWPSSSRSPSSRPEFIAEQYDEKNPTTSGAQFDVLIDKDTGNQVEPTPGVSRGGTLYAGRTYFQAPQIDSTTHVISKAPLASGELVRCTIVAADGYDLIAVPVEELERKVSLPLA
ncbi:MAG: hypothetical protein R3B67_13560 [Phycisphaerales bacterium]